MEATETRLIQAAQKGDVSAFNTLVTQYQDRVYNTAYRVMGTAADADDITQETFIAAYRRLDTFRGGSFRAWLLRITVNTCYDELRRRKRRPADSIEDMPGADMDDGPALPSPADLPETMAVRRELARAIQDCINALGPDQRSVLVLCDIDGMNYNEIAESTGAALGTVKSRIARARLNMRSCLQAVRELLPSEFRLEE